MGWGTELELGWGRGIEMGWGTELELGWKMGGRMWWYVVCYCVGRSGEKVVQTSVNLARGIGAFFVYCAGGEYGVRGKHIDGTEERNLNQVYIWYIGVTRHGTFILGKNDM